MMMMIMELMVLMIMITMIVSPGIEPLGDGHCCQNPQLHLQLDYSHLMLITPQHCQLFTIRAPGHHPNVHLTLYHNLSRINPPNACLAPSASKKVSIRREYDAVWGRVEPKVVFAATHSVQLDASLSQSLAVKLVSQLASRF